MYAVYNPRLQYTLRPKTYAYVKKYAVHSSVISGNKDKTTNTFLIFIISGSRNTRKGMTKKISEAPYYTEEAIINQI